MEGSRSTGPLSLDRDRWSVTVLVRVQRRAAIRSVRVYRTVSDDAVMVVAGMPPIDLIALERYNAFKTRKGRLSVVTKDGPPETRIRLAPDLSSPRGTTLAKSTRRVSRSGAPADSGREWTVGPIVIR